MSDEPTFLEPPPGAVGVERRFGVADVLRKLGVQSTVARCGRYVLVEKIGEGSMGVVYRARDPELDRDVAIKLLRKDADGGDRARLRREAHALARLNDPRVVTVLAIGEEQAQTWIAMELVIGRTLAQWSAATPADAPGRQAAALALLREAGLGLAAAHRAGLVHRDVKPANILIGDDGRVKVADFGLAHAGRLPSTHDAHGPGDAETTASCSTAWAGTPRYMAPEQHLGATADARSDQFAFAVSAWEVLGGEAAFRGPSIGAIAQAKFDGQVNPSRAVPRAARRPLQTAMSPDPDQRFATMDDLLSALTPAPRGRTAWVALGGATVLTTAFVLSREAPSDHPCAGLESPRWDAAARRALEASFTQGGTLAAPVAWGVLASKIDDYAVRWGRERDLVCSVDAPDAAGVACLAAATVGFDRSLGLAESDPSLALDHEALIGSLPKLDCAGMPTPSSPVHREIERALAEAALLRIAGDHDGERRILEQLEPSVRRTGDAWELARLLVTEGNVYGELGRREEALRALQEAHAIAVENGDDARALDAALAVIETQLQFGDPTSQTRTWLEHAEVAHARQGAPATTAAVWVLLRRADFIRDSDGDFERALATNKEALAMAERLDPQANDVFSTRAVAHQALADEYLTTDEIDDAERHVTALLENLSLAYGADHPRTRDMDSYLGDVLVRREKYDEAVEAYERALAARVLMRGRDTASVSIVLGKTARAYRTNGKTERALAVATEAVAVAQTVDPDSRFLAETLSELGACQRASGRLEDARSTYERVVTITEQALGADAFAMAPTLHDLGELEFELGHTDAAAEHLTRSLAIAEGYLGPDAPDLGYPLVALADLRASRHEDREAASLLARARRLAANHPDAALRARLRPAD